MKQVLILCTGNSCRSQIAEAIWREAGRGEWTVYSAGTHPAGFVHPLALRALEEIRVDSHGLRSKSIRSLGQTRFDLVVTVCDNAKQDCPVFPGAVDVLHWPFADPAAVAGTPQQQLAVFRAVRDRIRAKIQQFLAAPANPSTPSGTRP